MKFLDVNNVKLESDTSEIDSILEQEEILAELIATYGEEILIITNKIFTKFLIYIINNIVGGYNYNKSAKWWYIG